jgi:hypothetical protein
MALTVGFHILVPLGVAVSTIRHLRPGRPTPCQRLDVTNGVQITKGSHRSWEFSPVSWSGQQFSSAWRASAALVLRKRVMCAAGSTVILSLIEQVSGDDRHLQAANDAMRRGTMPSAAA